MKSSFFVLQRAKLKNLVNLTIMFVVSGKKENPKKEHR